MASPLSMDPSAPSVTIFAPNSSVTVTIEVGDDGFDDIHFHAGGQGVWIARAVARLGNSRVCVRRPAVSRDTFWNPSSLAMGSGCAPCACSE